MKAGTTLSEKGFSESEMMNMLRDMMENEIKWKEGRMFGYVFGAGKETSRMAETFSRAFASQNTLNPNCFPALRKFETDIVRMCATLLHGSNKVKGNVTSGGTESIFLALSVARTIAFEQYQLTTPEIILPVTAHPAFLKACHYLGLKPVITGVDNEKRADAEAIKNAINKNTILIVCSAPCFPYGVVDPVEQIARLAVKEGKLLHVDACMGGMMLPFIKMLGYHVPRFDFSVSGVTSVSLDLHKYGYAPKGCSVILYKNRQMRKKQFYIYPDWPGGIYASTTFMGTKSGGPVAGAWAVMHTLGKKGYLEMAEKVMRTAQMIRDGIEALEGLSVVGRPDMSLLAFTSDKGDIFNIGDGLSARGWHLDRLQIPPCLHLTVNYLNVGREEEFLYDLTQVHQNFARLYEERKQTEKRISMVNKIFGFVPSFISDYFSRNAGQYMNNHSNQSQAAVYGLSASFTNRAKLKQLMENMLDGMFG